MNNLPSLLFIDGELLANVTVSSEQMAKLNEARATFRDLWSILLAQVVPSLEGGWSNPIASEIESRLESITFATGIFFWKSRHAGAAQDAINVGSVQ